MSNSEGRTASNVGWWHDFCFDARGIPYPLQKGLSMLRTLTMTVAVALVSTAAVASPYSFGNYSEKLALSGAALDQGRSSVAGSGGGSTPYQSSANPLGTVVLPITDTDFTADGTGNYLPGQTIASYASGFTLSQGGHTVEFRNLVANNDFNTVYADISVNGHLVGGSATAFTFVNSIFGQSFQGLGGNYVIAFTSSSASALNTAFGLTGGNTIRPGTNAGNFSVTVPEPAAFALFGLGFGLIALARRRAA